MPKTLISCVAVGVALAVAGCGSSTDSADSTTGTGQTVTMANGTVTTFSPEEAKEYASDRLSLDAYGANADIADYCGALINGSVPRDVGRLSTAVDTMIDFHRDASNDESLGMLRDAAARLRECSDLAGDRIGLDAADRLTAAADTP